ncbi:hypothetical protein N9S07_00995 [Nitrosomonadales bacterium]|nr:hypothetical protein [Nitrosomonadales bacterium]
MTSNENEKFTYTVRWYFDEGTHHENPRMEEYHTKDHGEAMDLLEKGDFQMARVQLIKVPIKN